MPKILFWDIESTHLCADFGVVLCIGYKFLGDKAPTIIRIDWNVSVTMTTASPPATVRNVAMLISETAETHRGQPMIWLSNSEPT